MSLTSIWQKSSNIQARLMSTPGALLDAYKDYNAGKQYFLTYAENDKPVLDYGSVISLEFTCEGEVVSVPIEQGSFTTYNKTKSPDLVRLQMVFCNDQSTLQRAVATLKQLQKGTQLLNLTTPVQIISNLTIESCNYQQTTENSFGILFVDITLVEVKQAQRQYAKQTITQKNAKNPSNASTVNTGKKQPNDSFALGIVNKIGDAAKEFFKRRF
jgi:hypothetical protein